MYSEGIVVQSLSWGPAEDEVGARRDSGGSL